MESLSESASSLKIQDDRQSTQLFQAFTEESNALNSSSSSSIKSSQYFDIGDKRNVEPDLNEMILVIFGQTRCGKSAFINKATNLNQAPVGDTSGESTTKDIRLYSSKGRAYKLRIYDTPGLNDTLPRFTNEMLLDHIKYTLIRYSEKSSLDAIILFESCGSECIQLRNTLQKAVECFGTNLSKGCVVLISKCRMKDTEKKQEKIKQICLEYKLPFFMWESEEITQDELAEQTKKFIQFVKTELAPYDVKDVEQLRRKIEERALKIKEDTPKEIQRQEFEVEVKQCLLQEKEGCFTYTVQEVGLEWVQHYGKILCWKKPVVRNVQKEHWYTFKVPIEEIQKLLIQKDVEIEIPMEIFMAKARKEILNELGEEFISK